MLDLFIGRKGENEIKKNVIVNDQNEARDCAIVHPGFRSLQWLSSFTWCYILITHFKKLHTFILHIITEAKGLVKLGSITFCFLLRLFISGLLPININVMGIGALQ